MGGAPVTSKPVSARGVAGARGDRRGRHWGDILGDCSYSRAGSRGCDGGGVRVHGWVLGQLIAVVCNFVVPLSIGRTNNSVSSCLGAFLSSLIGKMEGKEREHEEN